MSREKDMQEIRALKMKIAVLEHEGDMNVDKIIRHKKELYLKEKAYNDKYVEIKKDKVLSTFFEGIIQQSLDKYSKDNFKVTVSKPERFYQASIYSVLLKEVVFEFDVSYNGQIMGVRGTILSMLMKAIQLNIFNTMEEVSKA